MNWWQHVQNKRGDLEMRITSSFLHFSLSSPKEWNVHTCCTLHVSLCYYCCSYWLLICVTWTNTVRMFYTCLYPLKILVAVANWWSSQNGRSSATAIYFCFQAIPRYQLDIFYYIHVMKCHNMYLNYCI